MCSYSVEGGRASVTTSLFLKKKKNVSAKSFVPSTSVSTSHLRFVLLQTPHLQALHYEDFICATSCMEDNHSYVEFNRIAPRCMEDLSQETLEY